MTYYVNIYQDSKSTFTDISAAAAEASDEGYIRTECVVNGEVVESDVFLSEDE